MLYMLWQMTRRNVKIYVKDKANIFFSLLSPLIVLALYILFIGKTQTDALNEVLLQQGFEAKEQVQAFFDSWMLSGVMACACITVALCSAGIMVQDKKRGVVNDLLASPVPKWIPSAAYFCSVALSAILIGFAVLALCFVFLLLSGNWFLSAADVFGCIGTVFLSVFSSTTLIVFLCGFIRTEGGFTGLNVILGTVIGFFIGAYMPVSMFPKGIQYFTLFIPGSYSAGLFRNFLMRGALSNLAAATNEPLAESLSAQYALTFDFFGTEITAVGMALALVIAGVFFGALSLFIIKLTAQKKR